MRFRNSSHLMVVLMLASLSTLYALEQPFHKGINLTGWFQAGGPREIQFNQYTYADFIDIQSLGVDVIRLPINLHAMILEDADHTLDPLFMTFLDSVVNWAEILDLHLILDNHTFDPAESTHPGIAAILVDVWSQIASHYVDGYQNLYYEVLNEPHGISDELWNMIQQTTVNAIRAVDSSHTIIIGPAGWNSYNNLDAMPEYDDDNLLYTFHFYDPFIFTHQGASWTDPSLVSLAGVPFPYSASGMPACPVDLLGTWIESSLASYATEGTVNTLRERLQIAADFAESRQVPLFCGELGVYIPNADPQDRVAWYGATTQLLDSLEFSWTLWDYHGGFGVFEAGTPGLFDHDLNLPLLEVVGFNLPEQTDFEILPDSTNIEVYRDFMGAGIMNATANHGEVDLYHATDPFFGAFCIAWANAQQYDHLGFDFVPDRDFSRLLSENYHLSLQLRGTGTPRAIDLRFLDTKTTASGDHPWRMTYSVQTNDIDMDGEWQRILFPLADMVETGSWDNGWFEPQGLFDWTRIDRLEIVAEQSAFSGTTFGFDEIRILHPDALSRDEYPLKPEGHILYPAYPNPTNSATVIRFDLAQPAACRLVIYDLQGREIAKSSMNAMVAGSHSWTWNGFDAGGRSAPAGIYLVKLSAGSFENSVKVALLP